MFCLNTYIFPIQGWSVQVRHKHWVWSGQANSRHHCMWAPLSGGPVLTMQVPISHSAVFCVKMTTSRWLLFWFCLHHFHEGRNRRWNLLTFRWRTRLFRPRFQLSLEFKALLSSQLVKQWDLKLWCTHLCAMVFGNQSQVAYYQNQEGQLIGKQSPPRCSYRVTVPITAVTVNVVPDACPEGEQGLWWLHSVLPLLTTDSMSFRVICFPNIIL